jgi:hypothetical protein
MLERNGGVIRAVAWSDVCPWLGIFRTFRLAIGFRALLMGAMAILITVIGWSFFGRVFKDKEDVTASTAWLMPYADSPLEKTTAIVPDIPAVLSTTHILEVAQSASPEMHGELAASLTSQVETGNPLSYTFNYLNQPLREGLAQEVHLKSVICLILCGLWSLSVWAFFGAAICRIASVQLATSERLGWGSALRHACIKYPAYFSAPLIPLLGVALAALPVLVVGLIMHLFGGFGVFLAALSWPLMLIAGLVMTLLLLGLFFGWPLMWGTISTEGTDSFDALSRSYAYVFQRPLHYLFYAIVASILGWLGWILVQNFASAIIWMTYWAASWGANDELVGKVMLGGELPGLGNAGVWLIHLFTGCVKLLAVSYLFSYFWTASVAIYFLLRRSVDATEMDEVFLDTDEGEKSFGLPKIMTDEQGAPVVSEGSPAIKPDVKPPSNNLTE